MTNPTGVSASPPNPEIKVAQKRASPDEVAPQANTDVENALSRMERLLQATTAANSPRPVPAPVPAKDDGDRPPVAAAAEPQAARPAGAIAGARPGPSLFRPVLVASAAAAGIAVIFALGSGPVFLKRPPSIPSMAAPAASGEALAGSGVGSPLPKEGVAGAEKADAEARANQNEPASLDNIPVVPAPTAVAAAPASPSSDAREAAAEPRPQSQALSPTPDRTASPPDEAPIAPPPQPPAVSRMPDRTASLTEEAPIAPPPAPSAAATEASPAVEAVKAPAKPEPKRSDEAALGAPRQGPEPPAQSVDPSGVGEALKPNPIAPETAPLPPVRPASLGKHAKREKTVKPHKEPQAGPEPEARAAAGPPQPQAPAVQPETQDTQPAGNPLLRAIGAAFK